MIDKYDNKAIHIIDMPCNVYSRSYAGSIILQLELELKSLKVKFAGKKTM